MQLILSSLIIGIFKKQIVAHRPKYMLIYNLKTYKYI